MTTQQVLNFHAPKVFKFRLPLTTHGQLDLTTVSRAFGCGDHVALAVSM
jgi:hypothetical protein